MLMARWLMFFGMHFRHKVLTQSTKYGQCNNGFGMGTYAEDWRATYRTQHLKFVFCIARLPAAQAY